MSRLTGSGALITVAAVLLVVAIAGIVYYSHGGIGSQGSLGRAIAPGTRISNFLLQQINSNNTVSGRLYVLYPLAYVNGTPVTLKIGDMVGYECDATEWRLSGINTYNNTATFAYIPTQKGPCPL